MDTNVEWYTHLEAIKLLKEWNSILVVVQIGGIAVIGGFYKEGIVYGIKYYLIVALISFLTSIVISASLIGSIPYIVQNFQNNYYKYKNIYRMRNSIGIPLLVMATMVHVLALVGLIAFCLSMYKIYIVPIAG